MIAAEVVLWKEIPRISGEVGWANSIRWPIPGNLSRATISQPCRLTFGHSEAMSAYFDEHIDWEVMILGWYA